LRTRCAPGELGDRRGEKRELGKDSENEVANRQSQRSLAFAIGHQVPTPSVRFAPLPTPPPPLSLFVKSWQIQVPVIRNKKTASAGAIQISRTKTATGVRLPGRRHHSGRWSGLASCHCRVVRGRRTARSRCAGALDSWTILILAFSAGPHQAGGSGLFQFEGPRHELESTIVDRCPTDRPRRRYRPLTAEIAHQPGNNHRPIDR
jgi:hypothetical protein